MERVAVCKGGALFFRLYFDDALCRCLLKKIFLIENLQ